jgi:HAE1 family hydrophobic/amphiphilic exporter-1
MGRAVIGGVITSTVLTLLIVPVLYTYLYRLAERTRALWHRKPAAAATSYESETPNSLPTP